MSEPGHRTRIIGRTMKRDRCVDCHQFFYLCLMVSRKRGNYCQDCFRKAMAEGREHTEYTYHLNGRDCTREEFEAATKFRPGDKPFEPANIKKLGIEDGRPTDPLGKAVWDARGGPPPEIVQRGFA